MRLARSLTFTLVLLGSASAALAQSAPVATPSPSDPAARQQRPAAQFKKLTRAEFDALLATPGRVLVLDVRRPDELTAIGGFPVYLSIQAADLEKQLAFIPRDRAIVTVSNHSARAGRAAELLTKSGFNVAGGIGAQDYEAEGGTLVKIGVPKADPATALAGQTPQAK